MKLNLAKKEAIKLINKYCPDYSFIWSKSKYYIGRCDYRNKQIGLNYYYTKINNLNVIKNVILEEISHALVGLKCGHNSTWKKKMIELGANKNFINHDHKKFKINSPFVYKWNIKCENCKKTFKLNHKNNRKKSNVGQICIYCSSKKTIFIPKAYPI
jgi:predicted SprT family Zn-dependent metalloprotease